MGNIFWGVIIFFIALRLQTRINKNKGKGNKKIYYDKVMNTKHRCVWCGKSYVRKNGISDIFCSHRCDRHSSL